MSPELRIMNTKKTRIVIIIKLFSSLFPMVMNTKILTFDSCYELFWIKSARYEIH